MTQLELLELLDEAKRVMAHVVIYADLMLPRTEQDILAWIEAADESS